MWSLYSVVVLALLQPIAAIALPEALVCPEFVWPKNYNNSFLPSPFVFNDGRPLITKDDWACRTREISKMMQEQELGVLPGRPDKVVSSFADDTLTINVTVGENTISIVAPITFPATGKGPFPTIVGMGGVSIPVPDGVAVLNFNNNAIAQQNNGSSRGVGDFYTLFGVNATAGAMMAWSWAVSRVLDVLEKTPEANVDMTHLAVTGCSRDGKGALVAGAFDKRFVLTIPQESGSGGTACWRLSNTEDIGGNTQTAMEIVNENVWFSTLFNQVAETDVDVLDFDHHSLAGMVAPRGLFVLDNTANQWLGPMSNLGCMTAARTVWEALGVQDNMGFSQDGDHPHCEFQAGQQQNLTAFLNKFLFDQNVDTDIFNTVYNGTPAFVEDDWINWRVPRLF